MTWIMTWSQLRIMQTSSSITITASDLEKQVGFCFDGYPVCSRNGFIQGKDKDGVIEVLEIEKQLFHRFIPPPPLHSGKSFFYTQSDELNFHSCQYEERFMIQGPIEEARILDQRLMRFRKQATEVKELVREIKTKQQKIEESTASGNLTASFQLHEDLNRHSKTAIDTAMKIVTNLPCNTILRNSLESKMKAAADISEYQQAQIIKQAIENYTITSRNLQSNSTGISVQTVIGFCDSLEVALQLCNYLTD